MKVHILPKTGIKESEKYAIQRMETEFSRDWRAYASFEIVEKRIINREIDVIILTHDRVLVVELKRWNGQIESIDGYWYLNKNRMVPSPVTVNGEKARVLKSYIERNIPEGSQIYVDYRIVLCGNSPRPILTEEEKSKVIQLDDFLRIKEDRIYKNTLETKRWAADPLRHQSDFDALFRRSSFFKPTEFSFQNYRVDGSEIFRHPGNLYREYKAVNRDDPHARALLRRWDFSQLGTAASTHQEWVNIAQRESRVYSYVKSKTDALDGTLLQPISPVAADQVTSDHCELFDLPTKQKRLFEFIEFYRNKLPLRDRIGLTKVLISKFAELHLAGVAHRDIGDHCVWLERPQSIRLSGFVAAYLPEMKTVGSIRDRISAITTRLPEDELGDEYATPFHRDVFLLAVISHILLFGQAPELEGGLPAWRPRETDPFQGLLDDWFFRSLNWVAKDRFANANEMLDALNDIELEDGEQSVISLAAFDYFQAQTRIREYKELSDPTETDGAEHYQAENSGVFYFVKVWYGLKPDAANPTLNHALIRFLEKARAIQINPSDWLPRVHDVGLTSRGLLYVRQWIDAPTLEEWLKAERPVEERIRLAINMVDGVDKLHSIQLQHGDLHMRNILVRVGTTDDPRPKAVFIDTPDFKNGSTAVYNTAYAPANYERISVEERDRYAVAAVIADLLRTSRDDATNGAFPLPDIYTELAACFKSQPAILTLAPLRAALEKALSPPAQKARQIVVTASRLPDGLKPGHLLSDNGIYYAQARRKDDTNTQVFIVGPGIQLKLSVNQLTRRLRYLDVEKITHFQFRHSSRPGASFPMECDLIIQSGPGNDADELLNFLFEVPGLLVAAPPEVPEDDAEEQAAIVEESGEYEKARTDISAKAIWRHLIDAEEAALPEVIVSGDSREHPSKSGVMLVPYKCETSILDFAPDEEVEVYQTSGSGERKKVAMLDHRSTNAEIIGLKERRSALSTSKGSRLSLQSRRDRSSYERRQSAVNRILRGASMIPNLVTYFDKQCNSTETIRQREPADEDLLTYDIFEDGRRIFSLNDDQKAALKHLFAAGPVGLLQGPPGTGKTSFIAAFLHHAVSKGGAQNILLVSQSHEATNNALEGVLELATRTGLQLDVVRVGEDSVLSDAVRHVGVSAIQESYRERFRSELKHRVCALSQQLGLPRDFVEEYCEAMIHLGRLAEEIERLKQDITQGSTGEDYAVIQQRTSGRTEAFWQIAANRYGVERSDDIVTGLTTVRNTLTDMHNIRSPDAVERLDKLIRISHEWVEVLASESGNFAEFLAKTRSIVAGTCVGVGRWNLGISNNIYDWVIIDEAARAGPSELAVAMQVGRRILLVGDHFQLPPLYKDALRSAVAKRLRVPSDSDVFDSDFERAFESPYGKLVGTTLLTQYRMAPAIGTLISKCFYEPRGKLLKNGRSAPDEFYGLLPELLRAQVVWADTSKAGSEAAERASEGEKSIRNHYEARVVVDILRHILTNEKFVEALMKEIKPGEIPIGVISMYRAQVGEIERAMAKAEWMGEYRNLVKVDTVDGYQGKQNRIIIVSLVRKNTSYRQGFLNSPNRLNVAMSRAMDRLIVVGATEMWRLRNQDTPLGAVLQYVRLHAADGEIQTIDSQQFRG